MAEKKDSNEQTTAAAKVLVVAGTNLRANRIFYPIGSEVHPSIFRSEQEVANLIAAGVLVVR